MKALELAAGAEYYPTARALARYLVRVARESWSPCGHAPLVLEPSAGGGAIVDAIRAGWPDAGVVAVEPHATPGVGAHVWRSETFEQAAPALAGAFDAVIMNPPFSRALEHVGLARACLSSGGVIVALLPLAYLASAKRAAEHVAHPPFEVRVLSTRASFVHACECPACAHRWAVLPSTQSRPACPACGGVGVKRSTTDARDNAVFVWRRGWTGVTRLKWAVGADYLDA